MHFYFFTEIVIKLYSEKRTLDFFKNGWNVFDFIVVLITLIPLENSTIATVARLFRVFRILRLITSRPELKNIIDMLIGAIPSIIDIAILLFIIFYIYAIIGNALFVSAPSGLWKDFLVAMLTLFRILTLENWTDIMDEAMEIHNLAWIYFVSFIVIAVFVFFNLFVAVIIGEMEKIREKKSKKDENKDKDELLKQILLEMQDLKKEIKELKDNKK